MMLSTELAKIHEESKAGILPLGVLAMGSGSKKKSKIVQVNKCGKHQVGPEQ